MDTLRRVLASRVFRFAAVAGLLAGAYALLGFYAAPRLVRNQAVDYVRETYGRELRIGAIAIHPFKLQVEVRDVALPDVDGQPMTAFARLFADFEISSLWHRAFVFREVALDEPNVRIVIRSDGTVNLADLVPPDDEAGEEGPLPAVWIQHLTLSSGALRLLNQLRRQPIERHLEPVSFTLHDFRTTPEGGDFRLEARSAHDEVLAWKGRVALEPAIESSGEFSVAALRVPGVAEFAGDGLPFLLPRGTIDLAGTYELKIAEKLTLSVVLPRIALTDVTLRARNAGEDWVEIPSLVLTDTQLAVPAQTVGVGRVTLEGLRARIWRAPDGVLNLQRLFTATPATAPAETASSTPPAAAAAVPNAVATAAPDATATVPAAESSAARGPALSVAAIELRAAALDFEDRQVEPAAHFAITPLNVTLRDASLDLSRPLPVAFDASINGSGRIEGAGQVVPQPVAAEVDLSLAGFEVATLQPYASGATDLTIRRGTVGAKGRFSMSPAGAAQPELAFAGDVTIADFGSIDNALEQDFINFQRVDLTKLRFTLAPDALSIDRVGVVKPFARVIVSSAGVLNAAAVFDPEGTAAAVAAAKAAAAGKAAEASRTKSRTEIRAANEAAAAAAKARRKVPPPPAPKLVETGMPIRIREVAITGGTMDFADFSIQPNFAAAVQGLGGRVTGLSTDPNSRATVKLTGNVGEFSPVDIDGTVQPFAYDRYTDIGLRFQNISLPVFNPYSGKFAGYNIAKGKLTTELHYSIESRRLNAQHNIRIEQLEWGEATAAKSEATLPVKFATSLLKDADGVISLDVPVAGTLDDPTFRIGPIVWQIIKNVLTKAVTAPFKALGALFKGAEEAQFVDFAPGQSALEAAQAEHLAALGKSLAPKTDLRLEVPIGFDAELDGQALTQARYDQELGLAMTKVLHGGRHKAGAETPALPAFDTLEPERRLDVLEALYEQLAGAAPVLPPPVTPPDELSRKERKAQELQGSLDWLAGEARRRAAPLPGDLERLGQARGAAIEKALLSETGLAPERVFVTSAGKVSANPPAVRLELAVK